MQNVEETFFSLQTGRLLKVSIKYNEQDIINVESFLLILPSRDVSLQRNCYSINFSSLFPMLPTPLVPLPPTLPTHGRAVHTSCTFSCPEISVWLLKVSLALLGSLLYPKKKRGYKKVTYKSIIKNLDLRNIVHGEEESLKRKMAQYLKSCSSLHCWEITHTPFAWASSLYGLRDRAAGCSFSPTRPWWKRCHGCHTEQPAAGKNHWNVQ